MSAPTETSPLLAVPAEPVVEESPAPAPESDDPRSSRTASLLHTIKILRILLFSSTVAAFAAIIAGSVVFQYGRFNPPWLWDLALAPFRMVSFFAFLFAGINLRWNIPYFLNLLADLAIPWFLVVASNRIYSNWPIANRFCHLVGNDPDRAASHLFCLKMLSVFQALLRVCIGFAVVVGVFHLTLFAFRTVVISKRGANQRFGQLSLWVPTGELTLSVTIKLLKQQTGMDSPDRRTAVNVEHGNLPAGE